MDKRYHADGVAVITAISHVTGAVAHDFNNVLTGILGNLELMQRRADKRGVTDFNDYLAGARSAATRGVDLTQRLIAVAGLQILEPKKLQTKEFIESLDGPIQSCLGDKFSLEINCPDGTSSLYCDAFKLEEALINLAKNARQANPTGATVKLTAQDIRLDADSAEIHGIRPGDYVGISMQDSGPGMSDFLAEHAFEPFFHNHENERSTGLGLATLLGFARQSGGHAFVQSHRPGAMIITLIIPKAATD